MVLALAGFNISGVSQPHLLHSMSFIVKLHFLNKTKPPVGVSLSGFHNFRYLPLIFTGSGVECFLDEYSFSGKIEVQSFWEKLEFKLFKKWFTRLDKIHTRFSKFLGPTITNMWFTPLPVQSLMPLYAEPTFPSLTIRTSQVVWTLPSFSGVTKLQSPLFLVHFSNNQCNPYHHFSFLYLLK